MTLLEQTRRLVLPPSSNLSTSQDDSWIFLLPGDLNAVTVGELPSSLKSVMEAWGFDLIDASDVPVDRKATLRTLVLGECDQRTLDRVLGEIASHWSTRPTVLRIPQAAQVAGDLVWYDFADSRGVGRIRARTLRAARLLRARAHALAGFRVPERSRSHPSDVTFVTGSRRRLEPERTEVSVGMPQGELPQYILDLASRAGLDLRGRTWVFGRPRGFRSQKAVFIIDGPEHSPEMAIKLTQESRFNARLHAEAEILGWLPSVLTTLDVPSTLFTGLHRDRLVVGQSAIDGLPFRRIAAPAPDGRAARSGFDGILDLLHAQHRPTTGEERRGALQGLVSDLEVAYEPPGPVISALLEVCARLELLQFPAVLMHGDFGVWNLTLTPAGRVGALDWENADPEGMPLWDLFVYARTLGVFLADTTGTRYSPRIFRRQFFDETPLRRMLFDMIDVYRREAEVPVEAVDGLFVMCWVQQAVREAATVPRPRWMESRSTQYVASSLAQPLGYSRG